MTGTGSRKTAKRPPRPGRAIAASLLVHIALLAAMGLVTPSLRLRLDASSSEPAMQVRLETERPERSEHEAAQVPRRSQDRSAATGPPLPILHRPPGIEPRAAVIPEPTTPSASAASAPGSPRSPSAGQRRSSPQSSGAGEGRGAAALRGFGRATIGCETAELVRLTPAERDACNQRFGAEARKAPPFSGIATVKRLAFDAAAERSRKCHFYDTPVPMTAPRDRNERIESQLDLRTPESQHKESTAVLPEDSLGHRLDCWP